MIEMVKCIPKITQWMKGDENYEKICIFSPHSYVYHKSRSDSREFKLVLVCARARARVCVCKRRSPGACDSKNTKAIILLESMVCAKIHDKDVILRHLLKSATYI
jgi:hypothetical protein